MEPINHLPQKIYQEKVLQAERLLQEVGKRLAILSWARLVVFWLTVGLLVYCGNTNAGLAFTLILILGGFTFILLVVKHSSQQEIRELQKAFLKINKQELARLKGDWNEVEAKYMPTPDAKHLYAQDLDVFGNTSLYKMLDRTGTKQGALKLQDWLLKASSQTELEERQAMVKELNPKLDFRQQLQAYGLVYHQEKSETEQLKSWIQSPAQIRSNALILWLSRLAPISALAGLACFLLLDWPASTLVLFLIPNFLVIAKTAGYIGESVEKTSDQVKTLKQLQHIMALIEKEAWEHPVLKAQANSLKMHQASEQVKKLANILYQIEARKNPWFYALVNIFILFDTYWMVKLEAWKEQYREVLPEWLESTAHVEALSSLAGFAYSHPEYHFPKFTPERFQIKTTQLGHPLIPAEQRVSNDFEFKGRGKTGIITGSNMSGKSTFERTVGVNAILAFAGAPVCAKAMEISSFQIFTSMRTQDSLEENVSGFYAELKRLEQLIQLLDTDQDIFYVLDEILKGTNSEDRNEGAKAIMKQVGKYNTFGLISTHDLSLGQLAEDQPGQLQNFSFNSRIESGQLHFDYTISHGVCNSFSATALMKRIGIEI